MSIGGAKLNAIKMETTNKLKSIHRDGQTQYPHELSEVLERTKNPIGFQQKVCGFCVNVKGNEHTDCWAAARIGMSVSCSCVRARVNHKKRCGLIHLLVGCESRAPTAFRDFFLTVISFVVCCTVCAYIHRWFSATLQSLPYLCTFFSSSPSLAVSLLCMQLCAACLERKNVFTFVLHSYVDGLFGVTFATCKQCTD